MLQGRTNYSFEGWSDLGLDPNEDTDIRLRSFKINGDETVDTPGDEPGDQHEKNEEDVDQKETEEKDDFKVPTRFIIIEPVMILLYIFHMSSSMLLNSQYIYYAIGEKYNLSALINAEKEAGGDNATSGPGDGGGGGVCGGSPDGVNSSAYKAQQSAQAEAAMFNFYMDLVSDIPGFFLVLFFGTLMDKFGRKPAMIIPMVGIILRAATYPLQMLTGAPLELLFLSGLLDAFTGGGITLLTAAYSYYADTIPPEKRGKRLIITDVVFGLSFSAMGFAMGPLIEALGFFWPYVIVIAGHIVNLLYIIFFVPESRKPTGKIGSISPKYIIQSFKVLMKKRPSGGRKLLLVFSAAWVVNNFARYGLRHVDQLFRLNSPFCWTPTMLSIYSSGTFLILMLCQLFIGMFLVKPLGDMTIILMSAFSFFAQLVMTGVAHNNLMLWIAIPVGFASSCGLPVMRAIFSKLVTPAEQGALNSSISSIDKIVGLISSFFFNFVYSSTLYFFGGTVFLIAAGSALISVVMMVFFKLMSIKVEKKKEDLKAKEGVPDDLKPELNENP